MKKMRKAIGLLAGALLCAAAGCGAEKAPESISLASAGYLFSQAGGTYNVAEDVALTGENVSEKLEFSSSDTSVAEISQDGMMTLKGTGSATVTVSSAVDEKISASADVLVYDYTGVYTGEKYVDAMGCDIRVSLQISEDGTFQMYRYPMYVNLEGGGNMEGLEDGGTYSIQGSEIEFDAGVLGAFPLTFRLEKGQGAQLSGDMPTGGARTAMDLVQAFYEDQGEAGTYTGNGEKENGEAVSYRLQMENGSYTLAAAAADGAEETISSGNYYFSDTEVEFFAEEGITFHAAYDAERKAIEGTGIPAKTEDGYEEIAATFTRQ